MKVCVLFGPVTLPQVPFPELKNPPCGLQGPWTLWPCSPAIDGDFQPQEEEEEDDEETIEVEEQQEGNDAETQRREIELLRHEGELPLEELLRSLPPQLLGGPFSPSQTPSHDSDTQDGPEENIEEEPSQDLEV